jgi:spermidine synthase
MKPGSWQSVALYSITIFSAAFLLFWVQLFFGKMLLPSLGGSPSVWASCLVFFQSVLALGYFLSHWITQKLPLKAQVLVQGSLMAAGLFFIPVRLIEFGNYPNTEQPLISTLVVLTVSVGVPFLALAGISPLIQNWFRNLQIVKSRDVYALYIASNLGSLGSLILYPFGIEPRYGISTQGGFWGLLYGIVTVLVMSCGLLAISRKQLISADSPVEIALDQHFPSNRQKIEWLLLALIPSSLLSGVSTYTAVQVAPFPLLWAIFLGLYLFTFVLVFSPRPQYLPDDLVSVLPYAVAVSFGLKFLRLDSLSLTDTFITFFFVTWACHSRLAQNRPDAKYLTQFYLLMSVGGALGGFLNAIVAPLVFKTYFEYNLVLAISVFALPVLASTRLNKIKQFGIMVAIILAVATARIPSFVGEVTYQARSFFGAYQVIRSVNGKMLMLLHGNTAHGFQFLDQRKGQPTGYYTKTSPIGEVFGVINSKPGAKIAIAGLGNGGLSAYAQPGQSWDYYEIDPLVVNIAQTKFDYLRLSKAPFSITVGDARTDFAKSPKVYDLIVMDAFTSDSIPQHLITREAVQTYLDHLSPEGLLIYHISNRYLDFEPVLGAVAQTLELSALIRKDVLDSSEEVDDGKLSSTWVVLSRRPQQLSPFHETWSSVEVGKILWSDNLAPLYTAIKQKD